MGTGRGGFAGVLAWVLGCCVLCAVGAGYPRRELQTNVAFIKKINDVEHLEKVLKVEVRGGIVPPDISKLSRLESLNLADAGIVELPAEIGKLSKLTSLNMKNNKLESIPEQIGNLAALETLTLTKNRIKRLPSSVGNLKDLKALLVSFNRISELPANLVSLSKLTALSLRQNNLDEFPEMVLNMTALRALVLSDMPLGQVPARISQLKELNRLLLDGIGASSLPEELSTMSKLTWLSCNGNKLEQLPENLPSSLETLQAARNKLRKSPSGALPKLTMLDLADNSLTNRTELSNLVAGLLQLTHLSLAGNQLDGVPLAVPTLRKLEHLNLRRTGLGKVAELVNLTRYMPSLESLDLSQNRPLMFVPVFRYNSKLERLILDDNELECLPAEDMLWARKSLKTLSLNDNKLRKLPSVVLNLTKVSWLGLAKNKLTSLPPSLAESLQDLGVLDLQGNPINCDRRLADWLLPLMRNSALQIENLDQTLCDANNEFAGQPIYRVSFSTDEPVGVPAFSDSIDSSARQVTLRWSNIPSRRLHDTSPDPYDVYFSDEDMSRTVWPCDKLGYKTSREEAPLLAFQVEWWEEGSLSRDSMCTWISEFDIEGLTPATHYYAQVRAIHVRWDLPGDANTGSEPRWAPRLSSAPRSLPLRFSTAEDYPTQPLHLTMLSAKEDELTLGWAAPQETNGVLLSNQVQVVGGSGEREVHLNGSATVGVVKGLRSGQRYSVRVRAWTSVGASEWSEAVVAETIPPCPAGFERQEIPYACVPLCPEGAYQLKSNQSKGLCTKCPSDFPRTLGGVCGEYPHDCVVDQGFMQPVVWDGTDFTRVQGTRIDCRNIQGTLCDTLGTTVANVKLDKGYWRIGATSLDIRHCPNPEFCAPQMVTSSQATGNSYCTPFHRGVLCEECVHGYAIRSGGTCTECSQDMLKQSYALLCLWVLAGFLLVLAPSIHLVYMIRRGWAARVRRGNHRQQPQQPRLVKRRASSDISSVSISTSKSSRFPWDAMLEEDDSTSRCLPTKLQRAIPVIGCKLRITLGFYQVFLQYSITSNLFSRSSDLFASFIDLNLSAFLRSLSMGCLVQTNFWTSLLVYTMYPLLSVVLMACVCLCVVSPCVRELLPRAIAQALWLTLQLCFIIYPGISATIFRAFLFDRLPRFPGDTEPYVALRADYTIDFQSEASQKWHVYSGVMVLLYPVGILAFFLACIRYHDNSLNRRGEIQMTETRLRITRAISFLPLPYNYNWFECFELVRKLTLTSLFILLNQFSERGSQLCFLCMTGFFLWTLKTLQPYRDSRDHILAEGSLVLIFALGIIPFIPDLSPTAASACVVIIAVLEALLVVVLAGWHVWDKVSNKRKGLSIQVDELCIDPPPSESLTSVEPSPRSGSFSFAAADSVSSVVPQAISKDETTARPPSPSDSIGPPKPTEALPQPQAALPPSSPCGLHYRKPKHDFSPVRPGTPSATSALPPKASTPLAQSLHTVTLL